MPPNLNDGPAAICERSAHALVPSNIRVDLGAPMLCRRSRHDPMLRAAVPKAAINEDGDVVSSKNKIRTHLGREPRAGDARQ